MGRPSATKRSAFPGRDGGHRDRWQHRAGRQPEVVLRPDADNRIASPSVYCPDLMCLIDHIRSAVEADIACLLVRNSMLSARRNTSTATVSTAATSGDYGK
jgi:hypothetical protein